MADTIKFSQLGEISRAQMAGSDYAVGYKANGDNKKWTFENQADFLLNDSEAGQEFQETFVKVQDTEPTDENNKIWIEETPENEVEVPTYDEFKDLSNLVSGVNEAVFNKLSATADQLSTYIPFTFSTFAGKRYIIKNESSAGGMLARIRQTRDGENGTYITNGTQAGQTSVYEATEDADYIAVMFGPTTTNPAFSIIQEGDVPSKVEEISDDVEDLKSAISPLRNVDFTSIDGYINVNGNIQQDTTASNETKTTQHIYCQPNTKITFSLSVPTSQSEWIAYGFYDAYGSFISPRVVAVNNVSGTSWKIEVTMPSSAYAIAFSYRSFGVATVIIESDWVAASVKYIDSIIDTTVKQKKQSVTWEQGNISANGNNLESTTRARTNFVPVINDSIVKITSKHLTGIYFSVFWYDNNKKFIRYEDHWNVLLPYESFAEYGVPYGAYFARIGSRVYSDATITEEILAEYANTAEIYTNESLRNEIVPLVEDVSELDDAIIASTYYNVTSINHRGFQSVAPENTLPAFKLSKIKGFTWIETDVQFTSDNVPVILHDQSINRTARNADGTSISETVNINEITYEQALTYDFGIWKSSEYAGTKVPTFEQCIALCRNIGLKVRIELKGETVTTSKIPSLVSIVKKYGMTDSVEWVSFTTELLEYIRDNYDTFALGQIMSTVNAERIALTKALRSGKNTVRLSAGVANITDELAGLIAAEDIPLDVWTITTEAQITGAPAYASTFTTNMYKAEEVLYNASMT